MQPLLLRKINEYYTTLLCEFVVLGIQHAMSLHHIAICGLPPLNNFPHFFIIGTVFKNKLLNTKCVL